MQNLRLFLKCSLWVLLLNIINISFSKSNTSSCLAMVKKGLKIPKGVIKICISKKNRQHNGQKKKYRQHNGQKKINKRTNNILQNIHIKLKIE